jgi:hypothetical protein
MKGMIISSDYSMQKKKKKTLSFDGSVSTAVKAHLLMPTAISLVINPETLNIFIIENNNNNNNNPPITYFT